jgi:hypothetical protein
VFPSLWEGDLVDGLRCLFVLLRAFMLGWIMLVFL